MQKSEFFAVNVPRYTSYPTAPHFHAGIDRTVYRQWLAHLAPQEPLSLYLHIPFCDTLCWFCGCHTSVVNNYAPVREYCDLLLKEIALVAEALGRRRLVRHIHWGGGSPTILQPQDITRLDTEIRYRFHVAPDAEFAVEIDPRGVTQTCVDAFARAGLTRASIGLQDCDPEVQKSINRIQSRDETASVVAMLRKVGVGSINIDLLYGLPKQTLRSWAETLQFAMELDPDRLAVFGYAHVPSFKKHQALIPVAQLPGLETRLELAELAGRILSAGGYTAVGLDHFAKPGDSMARTAQNGTLARNFQGYTTDNAAALIGLGVSAISALPQGYAQNASAVPIYRAALTNGLLPIARGIALTSEDRIRRYVIERLMCDLQVDLKAVCAQFGESPAMFQPSLAALRDLAKMGAISLNEMRVSIAPEWRTAARLVCAAFDAYLPQGGAKHSLSV